METVGIDLATEPERTGLARITWSEGAAEVTLLCVGRDPDGRPLDDTSLVEHIASADIAGVDCPLGWPEPFREFMRDPASAPVAPDREQGMAWRRSLAYRETDGRVGDALATKTGKGDRWSHMPLSASTDRLGLTAMRMASILAALVRAGVEVDLTGARGKVVEVYPGASLTMWGLQRSGYKGPKPSHAEARSAVLADLRRLTRGGLTMADEAWELCRSRDDALDALIAALVARDHLRQREAGLLEEVPAVAATEGWIALPKQSLGFHFGERGTGA